MGSLRRSCYGDYAALKPDLLDVKKGIVGWCPKLPENTGFTALRPAWAVVNIAAPRSSFDPVSAPALSPKTFFQKRLARLQAVRIMRGLGGGIPSGQRPARAAGLLLNNQIKTDVWALVGMVFTNHSDTTSDSLIQ